MEYPQKEGKHGPIYQIADGIFVSLNEYGSWQVILRTGAATGRKESFGKTEEDWQRGN